ncbi:MAG: flagellar hook assembly protein FlgD [Pseudomonadota bacterium]
MDKISSVETLFPAQVPGAGRGKSDLGQEDFMALLVAQLENQDPGKPMDNFDFLSQIAQFGMVDGIQNLQGSFTDVADSFRTGQLISATGLLGRQVMADSPVALLDQNSFIEGTIDVPPGSANISVEVRTAGGERVWSETMPAGQPGLQPFLFEGKRSDGEALPAGLYSFSATTQVAGQTQVLKVSTLSRVDSVSVDAAGELTLALSNGEAVTLDSIEEFK